MWEIDDAEIGVVQFRVVAYRDIQPPSASADYPGNGVTDRRSRVKWEQDGRLDARERARRIAKKILAAPEVSYLPEAVDSALRSRYKEIVAVQGA